MITTRRETTEYTDVRNDARSRLGLLERANTAAYEETTNYESNEKIISPAEDKSRMSKNFDILLNYEKYIEEAKRQEQLEAEKASQVEEVKATAVNTTVDAVIDTAIETPVQPKAAASDNEDIMPTPTTRQFGPGEIDNVYKDMEKVEYKEKFHLNSHSKLMITLYAIVVTVIMALIVINTSVLASLKNQTSASIEKLNALNVEYNSLMEEYENISSDEYVIEKAINEYNMVK